MNETRYLNETTIKYIRSSNKLYFPLAPFHPTSATFPCDATDVAEDTADYVITRENAKGVHVRFGKNGNAGISLNSSTPCTLESSFI